MVATRIIRLLRLGAGICWAVCKQRNSVVIKEEVKHEVDRTRDKRDHPGPAVVLVVPQLECPCPAALQFLCP